LVELIDLNALLDNLISEDGVSILVSESGDNIILELIDPISSLDKYPAN
jgi:hypothetical protein